MNRIISIAIFLLSTAGAFCQNINVQWARGIGGVNSGNEIVQSVAVDNNGNLYAGGSFEGTVNFNSGGTSVTRTSDSGSKDGFIAKYDSDGLLLWVHRIGSTGADEIVAVALDPTGDNVFVTGYFEGTVNFDPDGSEFGTSQGLEDIFYSKFSSTGDYLWVNHHGGTGSDIAMAIVADASNVYVAGYFSGTVNFNFFGTNEREAVGQNDAFFAKYDKDGLFDWANSIGSTSGDLAWTIDIDEDGYVYVGGSFSGSADFNSLGDPATLNIAGGSIDGFFAKYFSTGGLVWGNRVGGTGNERVRSLAVDASGGVYVSGEFDGSVNFDNNNGTAPRTSSGFQDIFVMKYDGTVDLGQFIWANAIGGSNYEWCNLMTLGANGNVYITGTFQGPTDFDPSSSSIAELTSSNYDAYVAVYASNGDYLSAKNIGGSESDESASIATDASSNVYLGGSFSGVSDFDPSGSATLNISSGNLVDGFIASYNINNFAPQPTAQPIGPITFSNVTSTSFIATITAPQPPPAGYIWLVRSGSSPTSTPTDGVSYTSGATIGDAIVSYAGPETSINVSPATPSTHYYFDVFAYNGAATTINYLTVSPLEGNVQTSAEVDGTPPVLVSNTTPTKIMQNTDLVVSAQFNDPESAISVARVYYIATEDAQSYDDFKMGNLVKGSGNSYSFTIPKSEIKALGISYYFYLKSGAPEVAFYPIEGDFVASVELAGNGLPIPFSSFGSEQTNYRIVSIPISATSSSVNSILGDDLGEADKSKWRMFEYKNGNTTELSATSSLQPKKGYWLIVNNNTQLDTGPGSMPAVSWTEPAKIELAQGWNLIGSPYPFDVSWADILDWNDHPSQVSKLRVYKGSFQDGTELEKFSGGFVMASGAVTLEIPTYKNPATGRRGARSFTDQPLDANNWEVDLKIMNGSLRYDLGGIGMNEDASFEIDKFDDFTLPRFFEYVELNHHKKFMDFAYSRDVVSTAPEYTWAFSVETNTSDRFVELSWDNSRFGDNEKQLVLWDVSQQRPVDMRNTTVYRFDKTHSKDFKIFFGAPDFISGQIKVSQPILHDVFPNPATDRVTFAFSVPESSVSEPVILEVFDVMGRRVSTVLNGKMNPGYHEVAWDAVDANGSRPASGVYVSYLSIGNSKDQYRVVIK